MKRMNDNIFSSTVLSELASKNLNESLEFLSGNGEVLNSWQQVFSQLEAKNHDINTFPQVINKMLSESGVTFNLYLDADSVSRPWNLDPIPLIYSEQEWNSLSKGLEERAVVWNKFLNDIYGHQRIIKDRILPSEIILNNASYLRPCKSMDPSAILGILNYSADVVRECDGSFRVTGDKAQSPFGIGYTLENRLALNRVYENTITQCRVKRLAGFFQTLSNSIYNAGRKLDPNPNIVILTPGPYNEGYYEHNLLSRYLGYTLARGSDLTVRHGRVYLKTIEGLRRVHILLRRQLDTFCDPLELRADSVLGIPGLVEAVRLGNVKVMNSLGSGIVNDHIFLHFYDKICRFYLDKEPSLKSVESHWLKEDGVLEAFKSSPLDYIVCSILEGFNRKVDVATLPVLNVEELIESVVKNPENYMVIPKKETMKVPSCVDGTIQLRRYKMRTFLCKQASGYSVLDGALCLVESSERPGIISIQTAQVTKDTWVLAKNEVPYVSLLNSSNTELPIRRSSSDMPSSVIDNLLWLSRYMERAACQMRILSYIYNSLMNENGYDLGILIKLYNSIGCDDDLPEDADVEELESHLLSVLTNHSMNDSLCYLLDKAIENAGVSRSRISLDTWKLLSTLKNKVIYMPEHLSMAEASARIDEIMHLLSAFNGLCQENMTRESGWRFLDTGKRIERTVCVSRMITVFFEFKQEDELEQNLLKVLLDVADSSMTYNSRYLTALNIILVMDLLIADDTNPRSLHFQLMRLKEHFDILPGNRQYPRNSEQKIISQAINDFDQIDFHVLLEVASSGSRENLVEYLENLVDQLYALSDSINRTYLSHIYDKAQLTYSER